MKQLMTPHVIGCLAVLTLGVCADDQSSDNADSRVEESRQWMSRRLAEMKEYRVQIDAGDESATPGLIEQPLLNWSNPLRSTARGALFVWTIEGKPQLSCCVFADGERMVHEMVSLADRQLTWTHPQRGDWQFEPLAACKPIPESPKPATNATLRLAQMRKLAKRFTAQVAHPELMNVRQLSQPIYRYPKVADVDGAIFAFVQGTDPECLLILEATEAGYLFRIARMTSVRMIVYCDGQKLHEFAPGWEVRDRSYRNFYLDTE